MSKRRISALETESNQTFNDFYFNIAPGSGPRQIFGTFTSSSDLQDSRVLQRLANKDTENTPLSEYDSCHIDVDPKSVNGFKLADCRGNSRLMMKLVTFNAINCPINISQDLKNNLFWVHDSWDGSSAVQSSTLFWRNTFREYAIPTAYYPDQSSLTSAMTALNADVSFTFDAATQLLTYTGTKPIILPFSADFTPEYYQSRGSVGVISSSSVPQNISGPVIVGDPASAVYDSLVNGVPLPTFYKDPDYVLDYLVTKLGFSSGNSDKIRTYFGYPQRAAFPNTSDTATTAAILANEQGAMGIVLYPLAKGTVAGNMYGSFNMCNVVCANVDAAIEDENILASVSVGSQPAYCAFKFDAGFWMPLSNPCGLNKYFRFKLLDLYRRPYRFFVGPPTIQLEVEARNSF